MKILHVVTLITADNAYGGPVSVARGLVEAIRGRGHQAEVLAGTDGPTMEARGEVLVPVRRYIPGPRFSGLFSLPFAYIAARQVYRSSLVHVHFGRDLVPLWAAVCARALRRPYVLQTHGMIKPDRRTSARLLDCLLTRRLLRDAKFVLALTEQERATLLKVEPTARIAVLPNGVASYAGMPPRLSRPLRTLFLARLHPRKRVQDFIDLAHRVHANAPDTVFTIAGSDAGDLGQVDAAMSHKDSGITYIGAVKPNEVSDLIAKHHVLVLPSVAEPFPMSVLEALAVGVPVIIREDCGLAPAVAFAEAGLTFSGDVAALYDTWCALLEDTQTWERASANARRLVATELSIESVVTRLINLYESSDHDAVGRGLHE